MHLESSGTTTMMSGPIVHLESSGSLLVLQL